MKASFIMVGGELFRMERDKNLEKEFNMLLTNIDIRVLFRMEKDLDLE